MRARDLMGPQATLRLDAPASDAAHTLARVDVRAVLVVDEDGSFAGVLSDGELLRALLPPFVAESEPLARVFEEAASESLFHRLEGMTVADLAPADREEHPAVDADDTLVEVASTMVRSRVPLVGVIDGGRLAGGISIDDLLIELLGSRTA